MHKKVQQGATLQMFPFAWSSDDFRKSSIQDEMIVDAIGLQFEYTNSGAAAVPWFTILENIDIRVKKDGQKVLHDCTALDLAVVNAVDNNILQNLGEIAIGAVAPVTAAITIFIPFHSPFSARPEDTSLVTRSTKSLMIEMFNRADTATLIATNTVETSILYENIGKGLPINSERYIRREGITLAAATANWKKPLEAYPYTRLMLKGAASTDLAVLTRLDVFGKDGMIYMGEPDEIDSAGQYYQRKDTLNTILLNTAVPLNLWYTILPLLDKDMNNIGNVIEQPLSLGIYTNAAFTGFVITDSISFPSSNRVARYTKYVYPSLPASAVKLSITKPDGSSVKDSPSIIGAKGNIAAVKMTPLTESDVPTANNANSRALVAAISSGQTS